MAAWRTIRAVSLAGALALLCPSASAELPGWAIDKVAPGIDHLRHERPGALSVHAARVATGAAIIRPVSTGVGGAKGGAARRLTSDLCRHAAAVLCVNADFFSGSQPSGGLVVDGVPQRSFRADVPQLSIVNGRVTVRPIGWSGRLVGTVGGETFNIELASLNRDPIANGISLYTGAWGTQTPPDVPRVELVLAAGGSVRPGVTGVVPVDRRQLRGAVPRNGAVLVATGSSAGVLNRIWHLWKATPGKKGLALHTGLTAPASLSIGGHPVLLRDGERVPLNAADPFVTRRHPRTLAGGTARGELLLVAVDGRTPGHSNGLTLAEATDLLLELGAVDAINLDGGGSTTFVGRCGGRICVRNRPSDGRERPVVSALSIMPRPGWSQATVSAAAVGPSEPAPAPVAPPEPAPQATAEDARPAIEPSTPSAEPVTANEPRPAPAPDSVALAPVADVVMRDVVTPMPVEQTRRVPATAGVLAAAALAAAAALLANARKQEHTKPRERRR